MENIEKPVLAGATANGRCPEEIQCPKCDTTFSPKVTDSSKCPSCGVDCDVDALNGVVSMRELFGDPIHTYTRADALNDGTLIDLNIAAPSVCAQHLRMHLACTAAVWNLFERAVLNERYGNDLNGILHDVLTMWRLAFYRQDDSQSALFNVIITGAGPRQRHTLKMKVDAGDNGEPVLTLMMPDED